MRRAIPADTGEQTARAPDRRCCTRARRPTSSRAGSPTSRRWPTTIPASRRWSRRCAWRWRCATASSCSSSASAACWRSSNRRRTCRAGSTSQACSAPSSSRARNLLGSDVAWLSTYDAERGEFHVLVADGALAQSTSHMVARRDRGVGSIVMSTRLPFTTADYLHDERFVHDPDAGRHLPRRRHRRAGGRAADLGRRGDRAAVRRRPLSPHAHGAEHVDPVHAGHARRGRAEERERLPARQRRAREGRAGTRRARAPRAQHPGRGRGARADDLAARQGRLAGDAVPVGRAAARRQRAGARRGRPGGQPRRAAGYDGRAAGERAAAARAAPTWRARCSSSRQVGRSVPAGADGESCRVMAGDRRRRRARLDGAVSPRRARRDRDPHVRAQLERRSASCCCRRSAWRRAQPRRIDAAALAGLAAPGRAGAAGRTRPSATASTWRSRWR